MWLSQLVILRPRLIQELGAPRVNLAKGRVDCVLGDRVVVVDMNACAEMVVPTKLHAMGVAMHVDLRVIDRAWVMRQNDPVGDIDGIVVYLVKQKIALITFLLVMITMNNDFIARGGDHNVLKEVKSLGFHVSAAQIPKKIEGVVFLQTRKPLLPTLKNKTIMLLYAVKLGASFMLDNACVEKMRIRGDKIHKALLVVSVAFDVYSIANKRIEKQA